MRDANIYSHTNTRVIICVHIVTRLGRDNEPTGPSTCIQPHHTHTGAPVETRKNGFV